MAQQDDPHSAVNQTTAAPDNERDLAEELDRAQEELAEGYDDPNCYGAGYDTGYRDGIRWALQLIRGEHA